ncbi:class I SAM-dependent methyltransferase [Aquimarina aquimarini]|uniref:class I SAM-dependent methyltransferase n=1 Tax=Aquimarina aquimarini TaxID=1191734 RepID=UPI000D55D291|nr:class I SAM-dependent methyltransferase [Aquimarina aquimarini]
MTCSLCASETKLFSEVQGRAYFECLQCKGILLHPAHFLTPEEEKQRYQLHQNDVNDLSFQKYALPIVNRIQKDYTQSHKGLDFGSGSGPVISHLLKQKNYTITEYDPFFYNHVNALEKKYDYIVCCEVIEHFYTPYKEFDLLHSLLLPNGTLYCKTKVYDPRTDFDSWWYKNDPTHVFFYTMDTIHWIKKRFNFKSIEIADNDLIVFTK